MLIVDSVADELRRRVKNSGSLLVWGLMFGKRSQNESAVFRIEHAFNASCFPANEIQYDSSIARHLFTKRQDGYELLGFFYSSRSQEVTHTLDNIPFSNYYYALILINTSFGFEWKLDKVYRASYKRVREPIHICPIAQVVDQLETNTKQSQGVPSLIVAQTKTIGNTALLSRRQEIQNLCIERGVTSLMHFTRLGNLASVLQDGLISRHDLELRSRYQNFLFSDSERYDGCKDAICMSISFPNYKMFWTRRQQILDHWIVLDIDARILWELDCAFCSENAASRAVRRVPLTIRKSPSALRQIFQDFTGADETVRRSDLMIPKNYPTHPQTEVLVFDRVAPYYIQRVYFQTNMDRIRWMSQGLVSCTSEMLVDRRYFASSSSPRFWEGIPM